MVPEVDLNLATVETAGTRAWSGCFSSGVHAETSIAENHAAPMRTSVSGSNNRILP